MTLEGNFMDPKNRLYSNRPEPQQPAQPQAQPRVQPAASSPALASLKKGRTKRSLPKFLLPLLVVVLLVAGVFGYMQFGPSLIAKDQYQAVFLTNGQVYFGKLSRSSGSYYKLSNVFYLQTTTGNDEESNNPQEAGANPDVQLIKLGNEVHGPEDSMVIERSQVLFFENLKDDGKVVSSIKQYQEKK